LNEQLREADHLGVVVEGLGQGDHLVSGILLVAVLAGGLQKYFNTFR
jgi:hypothetical protein